MLLNFFWVMPRKSMNFKRTRVRSTTLTSVRSPSMPLKRLAMVTDSKASRASCVPLVNRPMCLAAHRAAAPLIGGASSRAKKSLGDVAYLE